MTCKKDIPSAASDAGGSSSPDEPRKIEDVLAFEGFYMGPPVGVSMWPMLRNRHDVMMVVPAEGELRRYDVALYCRGEKYVLHRVVGHYVNGSEKGYVICGDNCVMLEYIPREDVLGNQSPLDYIAAVRDIYLPLRFGATTAIIPKELFMSPERLFEYMNDKGVTAVGWSVSALTVPAALGAFECSVPQHLRKVCFSGSVMPCSCLRQWQLALPEARFVNQYGPTEATASCTYYVVPGLVEDTDVLPIGKPYPHYEVFLLSERNEAVPDGEIGEICVKGPILALGYYNSREKTAESFLQNPLNHAYDERIYKTGDLGHFAPDGNLMFHGRKDRQVKHLGHRVELGEIDLAAAKVPGVEDCCALYDQAHEQIWLFYTGEGVTKRDIAVALRADLPGFMVPRKIEQLEAMPRLDNGKTNMRALAERITAAAKH